MRNTKCQGKINGNLSSNRCPRCGNIPLKPIDGTRKQTGACVKPGPEDLALPRPKHLFTLFMKEMTTVGTVKSSSGPRALLSCRSDPARCHFRCSPRAPLSSMVFRVQSTGQNFKPRKRSASQLYSKATQRTHKRGAVTCRVALKCRRSMRIWGCFLVGQPRFTPESFTSKGSLQPEQSGPN